MPYYNAGGIVLRRTNFSETDRIVTLYTRERGKVSCIAKGARKPISRLAGSTEVLTYGRYQLAEGRNLDIISQAEIRESFPRIRADLSRISHASYVAELTNVMIEEEHEGNVDVFETLLSALYLLERPNDPETIVRRFELQLMKLLGYEPALGACVRCRRVFDDERLFFSPSMGGLVCEDCGPLSEDAIELSPETLGAMTDLMNSDAPDVERMSLSRETMDRLARVMRWYIRYRAPRELKSAEFLQTLRIGVCDEKSGSCCSI